ncbi:GyrI-like domain-containing protein [Nocardiopsis sp. MG754419]|uniref:GyrI-like domain-containing protein n=1 Tax=Nocardiopsis sp. MG754419 TaxID=2259865 RepID=UPI001BA50758|nr:GyrI-like domain-containing protein [Nocardiopsis sp. MG754419]MBR8744391.1 hypothetical protein [Nocardiopsis sp. MG754419]
MTNKTDFKKTLEHYSAPRDRFQVIDVPEHRYLMVDGHGDPNTAPAFAEAIEALYPVAYALKFASRRDLERDYVVPPLEGLWWSQDMDAFTTDRDKTRWDWTLMLMVPDWIDRDGFDGVVEGVRKKKAPTRLDDVRWETLAEGRCVQTLHVGPFDDEADVLERLHDGFIPEQRLRMAGRHHEIYLSDFRKVAPEKRRTILRQPVVSADA